MTEYRSAIFPNHTLQAFGTQVYDGSWYDDPGGYFFGYADWRDEYGQGSRSYCGCKHSGEAEALDCIKRRHEVRVPGAKGAA